MNIDQGEKSLSEFMDDLPSQVCFTPLLDQYCVICTIFNNDIASACFKGGNIPSKLDGLLKAKLIEIAECLDLSTDGTKNELKDRIISAYEKGIIKEGEKEAPKDGKEIEKADQTEPEKDEDTEKGELKDFLDNLPTAVCFTPLSDEFCVLCTIYHEDVSSSCFKGGNIPSKLNSLKKAEITGIAHCLELSTEGTKPEIIERIQKAIEEKEAKEEVEFEEEEGRVKEPAKEEEEEVEFEIEEEGLEESAEFEGEEVEFEIEEEEESAEEEGEETEFEIEEEGIGELAEEGKEAPSEDEMILFEEMEEPEEEEEEETEEEEEVIRVEEPQEEEAAEGPVAEEFKGDEEPEEEVIRVKEPGEEKEGAEEGIESLEYKEMEDEELKKKPLKVFLTKLPKQVCFTPLPDQYCILCTHFNDEVAKSCFKEGQIESKLQQLNDDKTIEIADALNLSTQGEMNEIKESILSFIEKEAEPKEMEEKEEIKEEMDLEAMPAIIKGEESKAEVTVSLEAKEELKDLIEAKEEGKVVEEEGKEKVEEEGKEEELEVEENPLKEFKNNLPTRPCFTPLSDEFCVVCIKYNENISGVCFKGGKIPQKLYGLKKEQLRDLAESLDLSGEGSRVELIQKILFSFEEVKEEPRKEEEPKEEVVLIPIEGEEEEKATEEEKVQKTPFGEFLNNLPSSVCFTPLPDEYCILCTHFNKDIASICFKGGNISTKLRAIKKAQLVEIADCLKLSTEGTKRDLIKRILEFISEGKVEEKEIEAIEEEKEEEKIKEQVKERTLREFLYDLPVEPCFTPLTDSYCILCSRLNEDVASSCIKGSQPISKLQRMKKADLVDIAKALDLSIDRTKMELIEDILSATEGLGYQIRARRERELEVEKPEISEEDVCPKCGGLLDFDSTICPDCGFDLESTLEIVEERYECPECGKIFNEPVSLCPECGAEFEGVEEAAEGALEEEELEAYECPDCGSIVTAKDAECPYCGLEFDEEEEILEPDFEYVEEDESLERHAAGEKKPVKIGAAVGMTNGISEKERGLTNGLTNGITNGLTNGIKRARYGLTNGITNGLTNGLRALKVGITNGLTNGNGITNGLGPKRPVIDSKPSKIKFIVVPIILFALIISPYLMVNMQEPEKGIQIDGRFGDWSNVDIHTETAEDDPFNSNVDIMEYRIDDRLNELSFYLEVTGNMLHGEDEGIGRHMDWAYIFIDTDQMQATGYRIKEIGADFMVEVGGWRQEIYYENLYSYKEDAQDWSMWKYSNRVSSALSDSSLEVQIPYSKLNLKNHDKVDAVFYMQGYDGSEDFSDSVISNDEGVLIVNQQPLGDPFVKGDGQPLLMLQLQAINEDITVTGILLSRWGIGLDNDVTEVRLIGDTIISGVLDDGICEFQTFIQLSDGGSQTLYLVVDIAPDALDNNSIGFKIDSPHDITSNKGTITLNYKEPEPGKYDISYINSVPDEIIIDGAFADWQGKNRTSDDTGDANDNYDILEYCISNSSDMLSFYMKVDGQMCYGTVVPHQNYLNAPEPVEPSEPGEPGPPSPTPPPPTPMTGEDIAYIYIDSDNQSATGYRIGDLGAEHRIEVMGRYGKIMKESRRHLSYRQSERVWIDEGKVKAEIQGAYLEIQIEESELDLSGPYKVLFQTTDWRKNVRDYSEEVMNRGTRGIVTIQEFNTNNIATATTNQRTLIRTTGQSTNYFFSFYYNSVAQNITWEWSLWGDENPWPNSPQFVFTNAYQNMRNISVWYDDTDQKIYVVADNGSADNSVTVRNGSISGNSITWGSEVDVSISTLSVGNKNAFITMDADKRLWVVSSTMEGIFNYGVAAARSINPEDISLWEPSTTLTIFADNDATPIDVYPIILSIGTSGANNADMYAVWYNSSGYIQGKRYTDSTSNWDLNLVNIDNTGSDATDGQRWGPSAVVDSTNRDVHIVYVNAIGNLNYTKYDNSARSPDLPKTIRYFQANFPTISLVGSDDLYAYWVNVSVGGNNKIEGNFSTDLGITWSQISGFENNFQTKRFLTSVYYAPNEYLVGWHWTKNMPADTDVLFERIPEFQDIIVPVFFTIFMVAVWRRKKKINFYDFP